MSNSGSVAVLNTLPTNRTDCLSRPAKRNLPSVCRKLGFKT